ncbi:MAG: MFS transporter [Xanthobacteraceae bacterium]
MTQTSSPAISLLRHPAYVRFLYVRVAASVAQQIQVVAVGWQMYELTNSPFHLGLIGLVQFSPAVGLFVFTGHVADHYDRRLVTFLAQLVEAIAVAALAFANATGRLTPELLLGMAFVVGTGRAFEQPSLQSVLPNIVPSELLPRAIAGSSSASQTAVIAGPALGGILIEISPTLVFTVCAVLWLSAGLVMLGIAMEAKLPERAPLDLKSMFSGLTFMISQKVVLGAVLLDLFAVVLGNPTAVLPIFARDIYLAGPLGFGVLRAAPAAGAIATALILARWPISDRIGRIMFATVTIYGVATIVFALTPNFTLALAALAVVGASDTISVVIRQTMVQLRTPDQMRGRVYAVNSMVTNTSNQLGIFRAGTAAAVFGTVPSVLLGGLTTIAVVLISTKIFRELYDAERYHDARP